LIRFVKADKSRVAELLATLASLGQAGAEAGRCTAAQVEAGVKRSDLLQDDVLQWIEAVEVERRNAGGH
jgi:hypothetical protein